MLVSFQMQDTANPNPVLIIDRGLQQVTQMTDKLEAEYRVLHNRQDQFVLRYQEVIKLDGNHNHLGSIQNNSGPLDLNKVFSPT